MKAVIIISGIIQIIICSIAFFFKEKRHFLICNCTYNLILVLQYLIQGYFTELTLIFIDISRAILFYMFEVKNKKPNVYIIVVIEILYLIVGIITFENWFSIFVIISSMLGTFAQWQSNMFVLRVSYIICSVLLILNYIFTGLYATIIAEAISLMSALISIIKYSIIDKKIDKSKSLQENS